MPHELQLHSGHSGTLRGGERGNTLGSNFPAPVPQPGDAHSLAAQNVNAFPQVCRNHASLRKEMDSCGAICGG
jgi:hypothetical protein